MDTAADLSGEVGYVPLTYLAQFFGFQVAWRGRHPHCGGH